jgi:hypothetical protein
MSRVVTQKWREPTSVIRMVVLPSDMMSVVRR